MTATSGNAAGFDRIQYAVSEGGIPTDYTSLANDDTPLGLTILYAAQAADTSLPEGETVNIPGDDGTDAQFLFDPSDLEQFVLTVGRQNYAFLNTVQGTSNISLGASPSFYMAMLNPKGRDFQDMFFMLTRRASRIVGGVRVGGYEHRIVPLATGQYLGSAFATREGGAYSYKVVANNVQQTFFGNQLGSDSGEVGGKDEASSFELFTQYRATMCVYKSDGVATSFTPPQAPKSDGIALGWDAGDLALTTDPTNLALTVSGATLTFTAPDAGDYIVALYEVAS